MKYAEHAAPVLQGHYETFAALLGAAAEQFPDQEAYAGGADRIRYGDWHDQSLRLGAAFQARGVRPGDVVLVAIDNSTDFTTCFAAAQLIGGIASGLNTRLGRREIAGIVALTNPALMILADDAEIPEGVAAVIRRSELTSLRQYPVQAIPHQGKHDDIAVIVWTSGTTGVPKGASFSHRNLKSAIRTAPPLAFPFARKFAPTPFAHAGYAAKCWEQVAFGTCMLIMPPPWTAEGMLRVLVDEKANIAGGAPTQWTKLLALPEIDKADLSALSIGIAAMAPVPPDLIEEVERRLNVHLLVRYSMTECPSVAGTQIGDPPDVLYRTVGRTQLGVRIKLLDDDGNEVERGQVGRIAVHSDAVTVGYWNDPERTAEILMGDGWMLTGDYGRLDENGNLVLSGRTNEMYIRGGYNIYPLEVERVVAEHPAVAAVAVVGRPAPTIGEIGVAFVVPTDPAAPPTLEDIKVHVRRELADYKAPDVLVLLDALPLTPMMKIDKRELEQRAFRLPLA